MTTAWCPTCKRAFAVWANPPYSVMHYSKNDHRHPITKEVLRATSEPEVAYA